MRLAGRIIVFVLALFLIVQIAGSACSSAREQATVSGEPSTVLAEEVTPQPGEAEIETSEANAAGIATSEASEATIESSEAVFLSDMAWQSGSTGWVSMADDDQPALDAAFNGLQMIIGGVSYPKGIGVYPLSEIVYALDGRFSAFESDLGLNDWPFAGQEDQSTGVVFAVYVDGALAYDSGIIRHGQLPAQAHVDIGGASELRLVVSAAGPPSLQNFANWAGARLVRSVEPLTEAESEALATLHQQVADRARQREEDTLGLAANARAEIDSHAALSQPLPLAPAATSVVVDQARSAVVLGNGILNVRYGLGGDDHALLTISHLPTGRLILYHADASVLIAPGTRLSLHHDTVPARQTTAPPTAAEDEGSSGRQTAFAEGSFRIVPANDPVLGTGQRVDFFLIGKTGPPSITFSLTLFDGSPYYVEQVSVTQSPVLPSSPAISYFEPLGPSNLPLGGSLRYLTDISRLRVANVQDDGLLRRETVDQGKPVFLSSAESGLGLLLAPLDETTGENYFSAQVDPGKVVARLRLSTGPAAKAVDIGKVMGRFDSTPGLALKPDNPLTGPRLYVEVTDTTRPRQAFQRFRTLFAKLYPPLPLPSWVRYQWLSWYVYYMNINEDNLRRQIDYIAENLRDLGPWHIIVDAGWYVAEGRPDADWRNVDSAKFPGGLRALVDYAHSRNVRVVLYFSAPYLDSRTQTDDWLGLRAITDSHRDWLIPLGEDETHQSFAYDFDNPKLRAYLAEVMHDFFAIYDVDGIKLDGLGNAEGAVLTPSERDSFGLVDKVRQPTLNIYRFVHDQAMALKDDAYIESGWLTPLFANTLAHTFRYGDESPTFSSRYPWPGLIEHIEYAVAQKSLWGQRPNMGAVQGDPNALTVDEQWLQAALALGAQAVLSFDLELMTPETLSRYRSLLLHYRPFEGETRYSDAAGLQSFATSRDGLTFLGILNTGDTWRQVDLPLSEYGLPTDTPYAYYDAGEQRSGLTQGSVQAKLEPRSFRLVVLRPDPGVLWSNSSYSVVSSTATGLTMIVSGPASLTGQMQVFAPAARSVQIDGEVIGPEGGLDGSSFERDEAGVLSLQYSLIRPRRIELLY